MKHSDSIQGKAQCIRYFRFHFINSYQMFKAYTISYENHHDSISLTLQADIYIKKDVHRYHFIVHVYEVVQLN